MGIYVNICSSNGRGIATGKYGVGFAILMFSRYEKTKKQFKYVATGDEAINNLNKYIAYIQANMNDENEDALFKIQDSLEATMRKVRKDETYELDYSEIMGMVENPAYNPMYPVIEMAEKIDDAIWGYSRFGSQDTIASKMMQSYLQTLSPHFSVSSIVHEQATCLVFTVSMYPNSDDEWKLETKLLDVEDKDSWQKDEYYQRRLFMILKKSGLKFEWLSAGSKSAYVFIDKQYLYDWVDTKPFVMASYQLNTTHRINYLLENTPENRERFYNYVMSQENRIVESVVIDNVELLGLAEDKLSTVFGKKWNPVSCQYSDVVMFAL